MQRREFITIGLGGVFAGAGCLTVNPEVRTATPDESEPPTATETPTESPSPEPERTQEVVVNERVFSQGEIFNFEAESGDTIHITVDNEAGWETSFILIDPSDEPLLDGTVETEESFEVTADETGVHRIDIWPDSRASVEVTVES